MAFTGKTPKISLYLISGGVSSHTKGGVIIVYRRAGHENLLEVRGSDDTSRISPWLSSILKPSSLPTELSSVSVEDVDGLVFPDLVFIII
jgi:hypothetical protein